MNIAVCIKQTPDTTTRVKIADDQKSIIREDLNWIINPYDEFAIEEALRLTEKHTGEVTVISLGPASIEKNLREALAMGAHKGIRIPAETIPDDPMVTARALAAVLQEGQYDLILLGKQAVDNDHSQMPGLISQAMELPCATAVVKLDISDDRGQALREIDGGYEVMTFPLPAVIGAHRHLNEPRYRTLKGIMQAKKKKIDLKEVPLTDSSLIVEKLENPPAKGNGKIFNNGAEAVPELIRLLREEAKII